jgi:hypothetical protein
LLTSISHDLRTPWPPSSAPPAPWPKMARRYRNGTGVN